MFIVLTLSTITSNWHYIGIQDLPFSILEEIVLSIITVSTFLHAFDSACILRRISTCIYPFSYLVPPGYIQFISTHITIVSCLHHIRRVVFRHNADKVSHTDRSTSSNGHCLGDQFTKGRGFSKLKLFQKSKKKLG